MSSDLIATVTETQAGFHVEGCEKITYDFTFLDGVFDPQNRHLAILYKRWGRCLAITDINVCAIYGEAMQRYFAHHGIDVKIFRTTIDEQAKTMNTMLAIFEAMTDFGVIRKEPVCESRQAQDRLGAYHAPMHTFLNFTFLRTLPTAHIRNGFAELIKISTCADLGTFQLLDKYCEALIATGFGRADGSPQEVITAADKINRQSIFVMLQLETPNLHELGLDRRHGHAISVDMAYSATLAYMLQELTQEEHARILGLLSRAGLTIDHELFTESLLEEGTSAILKTRDGKLRAAIPSPLGKCKFLNDVTKEQMFAALHMHTDFARRLPRQGAGIEASLDDGVVERLEGVTTKMTGEHDTGKIHSKGIQVNVSAFEEGFEGRVMTLLSGSVTN
ncbi:hypothetical protein EV426DRAFT_720390 [Tirmania nivea]|nr:hypothetical protein EV426DRAFT_720390 [Tirmania nivea]